MIFNYAHSSKQFNSDVNTNYHILTMRIFCADISPFFFTFSLLSHQKKFTCNAKTSGTVFKLCLNYKLKYTWICDHNLILDYSYYSFLSKHSFLNAEVMGNSHLLIFKNRNCYSNDSQDFCSFFSQKDNQRFLLHFNWDLKSLNSDGSLHHCRNHS